MYIIYVPIGVDESDFGKEKVKSLYALTTELITEEAAYLESLKCIVEVKPCLLYVMV